MTKSVGHRIREQRTRRGMSLRGLAEKSGVNFATISRIETGKRQPLLAQIQQLAKALRVPPRTLIPARAA
jgi:transcriptional regulator with XRE-family HTH domain